MVEASEDPGTKGKYRCHQSRNGHTEHLPKKLSQTPRDHFTQHPATGGCTGEALGKLLPLLASLGEQCWAEHFVVEVAELLGARALEQREPFPEGNLHHHVAQQPQLPPLQAVQPQQPLGAVAEVVPVGHLQCQPHLPRLPEPWFRHNL